LIRETSGASNFGGVVGGGGGGGGGEDAVGEVVVVAEAERSEVAEVAGVEVKSMVLKVILPNTQSIDGL
jgi:hypothetical protein